MSIKLRRQEEHEQIRPATKKMTSCLHTLVRVCLAVFHWLLSVIEYLNIKQLWRKIFHMKISDNTSFSLQPFLFVHIPAIFSVLLTRSLKITILIFWPTLYITMRLSLSYNLRSQCELAHRSKHWMTVKQFRHALMQCIRVCLFNILFTV